MIRRSALVLSVVSAVAVLSAVAPPLLAADIVVNRYDDVVQGGACTPASCSLREAVLTANQTVEADTIWLSAGTYVLSRAGADENNALFGDLDLLQSVTIVGAGANLTSIDASGIDRVIDARSNASANHRIVGVTLRGGAVVAGSGATALEVATSIALEDCEVRDNGDESNPNGAVIHVSIVGSLVLERTTLADNVGVGLVVVQGVADLSNTTVANQTQRALHVSTGGQIACRHCTIRKDSAVSAVDVSGSGSEVELTNSVVLGPCATSGGGVVQSFGGNVESPGTTCGLDQQDDEDGVPAIQMIFGPLELNGGTTRTLKPLALNHALDAANDGACLADDQRGAVRPAVFCDRGALERESPAPATPIFLDGFEQGSPGAWSSTVGG